MIDTDDLRRKNLVCGLARSIEAVSGGLHVRDEKLLAPLGSLDDDIFRLHAQRGVAALRQREQRERHEKERNPSHGQSVHYI